MRIQKFLVGHESWKARLARQSGDALKVLAAQGQRPEALVISCSDSRVVPELMLGADPGNLFVVRNIANLVPPNGSGNASVAAAIAYAVDHLKVAHVIVLGHYGCGGMAALRDVANPDPHGHALGPELREWLKYGLSSWEELVTAGGVEDADWHDRLVEENVFQQLANVVTYPSVVRAVDEGRLLLHAWVYDLAKAELRYWDMQSDAFVTHGMAMATGGTVTLAEIAQQDRAR